jgi:UDP:flavonoid glycosyltransferase YjiC (YdhE family)
VRILVTTTAGLGHVLPVLRTATELLARGHEVTWLAGPGNSDVIVDAGFDVTVAGMPVRDRLAEFFRRYPDTRSLPEDERRAVAFSKLFGELSAPPVVEALRPIAREWRPDVVLHDAAELAGPLVAASIGVPSVCHGFGEIMPEKSIRRTGEQMAPLWRESGLEPDEYAGSYRGLYVDIYPPSLRSQDMAHVAATQLCRPADGVAASGGLVYVTFGTVWNVVDDGFHAAVQAAASLADEVLVTVGPAGDPASLGTVPANVVVERYVPQAEVLPRSAAVVCHGGSGTVLASLAHGVPVICLPRGADQFANAANLERAGAGVMVSVSDAAEVTALTRALHTVLETPAPKQAAVELGGEIAAMPAANEVADAIERAAHRLSD